jgi:hypothetical protein
MLRSIQIDSINIDVEGDGDLRGFTGISNEVQLGAQQFRVNMNIKSTNASKQQINELHEIGKRFSPAFETDQWNFSSFNSLLVSGLEIFFNNFARLTALKIYPGILDLMANPINVKVSTTKAGEGNSKGENKG